MANLNYSDVIDRQLYPIRGDKLIDNVNLVVVGQNSTTSDVSLAPTVSKAYFGYMNTPLWNGSIVNPLFGKQPVHYAAAPWMKNYVYGSDVYGRHKTVAYPSKTNPFLREYEFTTVNDTGTNQTANRHRPLTYNGANYWNSQNTGGYNEPYKDPSYDNYIFSSGQSDTTGVLVYDFPYATNEQELSNIFVGFKLIYRKKKNDNIKLRVYVDYYSNDFSQSLLAAKDLGVFAPKFPSSYITAQNNGGTVRLFTQGIFEVPDTQTATNADDIAATKYGIFLPHPHFRMIGGGDVRLYLSAEGGSSTTPNDDLRVIQFIPLFIRLSSINDYAAQFYSPPASFPQKITFRGFVAPDDSHTINGYPSEGLGLDVITLPVKQQTYDGVGDTTTIEFEEIESSFKTVFDKTIDSVKEQIPQQQEFEI